MSNISKRFALECGGMVQIHTCKDRVNMAGKWLHPKWVWKQSQSEWKALEALGHRIFYMSTISWEKHKGCVLLEVSPATMETKAAPKQIFRQLLLDHSHFVSFTTYMREMWGFVWQAVGYRLHLPILYSQSCCSAGLQLHSFCGWPSFHHFGETEK